MSVRRGDVVMIDFPFSDRAGSKVRPALVLSTDRNNGIIDDAIFCAISRYTRSGAFTHVFVDPATPDGRLTRLLHPSYIQCENLFTLDERLVIHTLGRLPTVLMQAVEVCLVAAFDLP
jgi:mRNA interferase MazF